MVPVINAANHHYTAAATLADIVHYDADHECFELKSGKHYNAGDQFYIIYGQYSNAKLLYSYGFTLVDNIYHGIDLWVNVPPGDSNAQLKRAILQENALTAQQQYDFSGTIRKSNKQQCTICAALLATARIIAMAQDELQQELEHHAFKGQMISVRNEQAVYTSLIALLQRKHDSYTIAEYSNDDYISSGVPSDTSDSMHRYRYNMAFEVVTDDKMLLTEAIALLSDELQSLHTRGSAFIPMDNALRLQ
jgi:Rubisco LSMT substrate-binding